MFCNIIAVRRWWITKCSSSGWKPNLFLALLYVTHGEEFNKVSMCHLLTRELTVIVERPWNICSQHWGIDCQFCDVFVFVYLQSSIGVWRWRRWGPSIKCRIPISPNCKMKDLSSGTKYFFNLQDFLVKSEDPKRRHLQDLLWHIWVCVCVTLLLVGCNSSSFLVRKIGKTSKKPHCTKGFARKFICSLFWLFVSTAGVLLAITV